MKLLPSISTIGFWTLILSMEAADTKQRREALRKAGEKLGFLRGRKLWEDWGIAEKDKLGLIARVREEEEREGEERRKEQDMAALRRIPCMPGGSKVMTGKREK